MFWPGLRVFFFGWPKTVKGVELESAFFRPISPIQPRPGYETRTGPEGPGAFYHEDYGYSRRAPVDFPA